MLLCKSFDGDQQSLLDHQSELALAGQVDISRQSIHERFTPEAVKFIKALLAEQITASNVPLPMLSSFSGVFLHDSTRFKLPDHLKELYKGPSGDGGAAGCSIQCCYDLRNHCFKELSINAMVDNDSSYATSNSWITPCSLVLRDLGYFSITGLKQIEQKDAFYISKVSPRTQFYDLDNTQVPLARIVDYMDKYQLDQFEKQMLITTAHKHPVRVIFRRVSQQLYEKRIRARSRKNHYAGSKLSKDYTAWSKLIVLVTNVASHTLSADQVLSTYRLRWQIELVFKTWKSHYKLHKTKKMKQERIECYIYSMLLLVTVHWKVYRWLQQVVMEKRLYISLYKLTKYLRQISPQFNQSVVYHRSSISTFISEAFEGKRIQTFTKESRKGKLSYSDIIESFLVNYDSNTESSAALLTT